MLRRLKSRLIEKTRELSHKDKDEDTEFAKFYSDFYQSSLPLSHRPGEPAALSQSRLSSASWNQSVHEFYGPFAQNSPSRYADQPRGSASYADAAFGSSPQEGRSIDDDMGSYYGPINPDLLGGFGSPVPLPIPVPTPTARQSTVASTVSSSPKFSYRGPDPSILADFGSSSSNQTSLFSTPTSTGSSNTWSATTGASSSRPPGIWSPPPAPSGQWPTPNPDASSRPSSIPATGTPLRLLASLLSTPVPGTDRTPSQTAREQPNAITTPANNGSGQIQRSSIQLPQPASKVPPSSPQPPSKSLLPPQTTLPEPQLDPRFGQRYVGTDSANGAIVTKQRTWAVEPFAVKECVVCAEEKPGVEFPIASLTIECGHEPATCLECVRTSIRTDLTTKIWNEIGCPECSALLEYTDVEKYADPVTFTRYEGLAIRFAMSESPNFVHCTSSLCMSGQYHISGSDQPIVTCVACGQRTCFNHKEAWHESLTCREYDAFKQDPENFRSWVELENERVENEYRDQEAARRAQEEADRAFAQSLVDAEQAAEAALIAEIERQERERREKEEQERRREEERKREEARLLAAKKKRENAASERTISTTTKSCPGCKRPIEKNHGCAHMTCIKCKHEFCWDCLADYKAILAKDNSVHATACKWHPNNVTSEVGVDSEAEDDSEDDWEDEDSDEDEGGAKKTEGASEVSEDEVMTHAEGSTARAVPAAVTVTSHAIWPMRPVAG